MADTDTKSLASNKRASGRRTARACDECRLRKSKCDGLQPCEACQTTDRYCTYNLSAGQSTRSGTRIRILEDRLRRARAYLFEAQKRTPSLANVNFDALLGSNEEYAKSTQNESSEKVSKQNNNEAHDQLESMMDSYGHLNLNANGTMERNFYGAASGLAWLRKAGHYFEDSESDHQSTAINSDADIGKEDTAAVQLFDAPLPHHDAFETDLPIRDLLPPREVATHLLEVVFTQVYPMFHFLSEEDFQSSTDRIYGKRPEEYQECEQSFLPLFYLVMALGYLFSSDKHREHGCRMAVTQAMRLFITARKMLDIAHLRTIVSLQTVISLILYLVSTARMASAHAYVGAACASAMRQGLHFRSTHDSDLPMKEKKVRRRVFWAVVNLDMYITSILGLPPFMDMSAVDPAIDMTIEAAIKDAKNDANFSTTDDIALTASAKHIELMRIIFKAQRTLFPKPIDPPNAASRNGTISVDLRKLEDVEHQFQIWAQSLEKILLHPDDSVGTQSVKYEVHLSYYFAQIVLYRPFLHHLAKHHDNEPVGQRQLNYARTCVQMAKKVIETSVEHQRRGLLCPASWQSVYTVFMSSVCLIFAYATRHDKTAKDGRYNIENGIRLLASTACTTDTGSVRCLEILRRLIKRVSYAVDVDIDQISVETQLCCMTGSTPKGHGELPPHLNQLQTVGGLASQNTRGGSVSSLVPSIVSGEHQWSISPDVTMTQPSFSEIDYGANLSGRQSSPSDSEQTLQVPYGGLFDWQSTEYNTDTPTSDPMGHSSTTQSNNFPHPTTRRLTADEITAFMQSNHLDDTFARRSP